MLPGSLAAQTATYLNAPSPEKIAVSAGGVDVRTGRYAYSKTDLKIGEGTGSLSLERTMTTPIQGHVAPFGNLSHNWDIVLVVKATMNTQYNTYDYLANVSYGGRSQTFEKIYPQDPAFRQKSQNDTTRLTTPSGIGASNAIYSYTATDGTVVVFRPIGTGQCTSASFSHQCANVDYIVEPDGTRFDFEYETGSGQANNARLRSVTSSRGYGLLLEYGAANAAWNHVAKACVLNLAVTAKPASNICPVSAQTTTTYSYTGATGRVTLASATAPNSTTDAFTYTTATSGQAYQMGFVKPGQSAAWLTNSLAFGYTPEGEFEPYVTSQSLSDGGSYSYNYDLTPDTRDVANQETSYQSIAGGYYLNVLGHKTEVRYAFPRTPGSFNPPRVLGVAGGAYYVYVGDSIYQTSPGPVEVIDPLDRVTISDYCDANAMANLPASEHNRCLIAPLQSVTDPEGNLVRIKYGYNNQPNEIRHVAKPGSGLADIVETASQSSTTCTTTFIVCGKPLSVTDAKGIVTDYTWDPAHGGMLTETLAAPSAGATRPQKRYTWAQHYAWYKNAAGTLVQSPYPTWLLTQVSECATGAAPACVGTADETRTTFAYGPSGAPNNLLPVSKSVAAGDGSLSATTAWTYDEAGNKLTEDGPLAGTADTTRWRYDVLRRVIGVIGPDPDGAGALPHVATRNTYDPAGRLVKVEQGTVADQSDTAWAAFAVTQTAETAYDPLDRKIAAWAYGFTGGIQSYIQYKYDLAGRLECTAVRMNPANYGALPASACALGAEGANGPDRITRNIYDAAGQLLQVREGVGTAVEAAEASYAYTLNGKRAQVIDGNGNRAELRYDGHDRQVRWVFPAATGPAAWNDANPATALTSAGALNESDYEAYGYDLNGNRISLRKRDGSVIGYAYDALNRMTVKTVPERADLEATHTRDIYYSYDLRSLQTAARFDSLTGVGVEFQHDAFGRMTAATQLLNGISRTLAYQYDSNGNRTRLTYSDGAYVSYQYDPLGRPTAILRNGGAGIAAYTYSASGERSGFASGLGLATTYDYDPVGRLSLLTTTLAASSSNNQWSFIYNPASQIASLTRSNDAFAWTGSVNVDRPYTANGLNQYTAAGPASFCYDANGNLTADGTRVFVYDVENRLIRMHAQAGSACPGNGGIYGGAVLARLRYDPLGRMLESQGAAGPSSMVRYLHDGDALNVEYDTGATVLRRYVHGADLKADDPIAWYEGAGFTGAEERLLRADRQGSIVLAADSSGSTVHAINRYDEYGIPAAGNAGRFGYTGQVWVAEVGMWYYKARWYSPT
ncbi:MAG: hypothetical protein ACREBO_07355, partial [Novosphingobium sp.]